MGRNGLAKPSIAVRAASAAPGIYTAYPQTKTRVVASPNDILASEHVG